VELRLRKVLGVAVGSPSSYTASYAIFPPESRSRETVGQR
jgi:hypothetical protein